MSSLPDPVSPTMSTGIFRRAAIWIARSSSSISGEPVQNQLFSEGEAHVWGKGRRGVVVVVVVCIGFA
jgi:hypothetical protein